MDEIIYALPQSITKIIAALGGMIFLYLVFQIILVIFNKRRQKILELIRKDLNRIEKKIDALRSIPKEGIRTSDETSEKKRNKSKK